MNSGEKLHKSTMYLLYEPDSWYMNMISTIEISNRQRVLLICLNIGMSHVFQMVMEEILMYTMRFLDERQLIKEEIYKEKIRRFAKLHRLALFLQYMAPFMACMMFLQTNEFLWCIAMSLACYIKIFVGTINIIYNIDVLSKRN